MPNSTPHPNGRLPWWQRRLYRLYDRLTRSDPVAPADLIFVLAGRMERKPYGLDLFRSGIAPRLLLSIGRFEVSKMHTVDAATAPALLAQRDRTPAAERHFFCDITAAGTAIEKVALSRWNTYGELAGLRRFLEPQLPRTLLFVSTDVHLRRVALTFDRVFRGLPVQPLYCPVPAASSSVDRHEWWTRPADRRFVLKETIKLAAYQPLLRMPQWIVRRTVGLPEKPA